MRRWGGKSRDWRLAADEVSARSLLGEACGYNYCMKKLRPRVRALKLATEVRQRLAKELGVPVKVIMFGSQARGDATKYSDIDLLVILPIVDRETRKLVSSVAWEVGFDAGKIISTFPTTRQEMEYYAISPFYKTIKKEGIPA